MIKLTKSATTKVVLTLNEKSQLYESGLTPYFLFQFNNSQSYGNKTFIPIYVSANTTYNVFNITESLSENLTAGTVSLSPGFYSYKIWEQASQYNTNVNNAIGLVEQGKVFVAFPNQNIRTYSGTSAQTNVIYYRQ